jgi:prevent-host-death family protein
VSEHHPYTLSAPPPTLVAEPNLVGAYEAKTHLARMLDEVEQGGAYVITRHGRPVARLMPAEPQADVAQVVAELRALRKRSTLGPEVSLRELIEEGRR